MRGIRPHREPTTLDVLDHVLDKGIVIDAGGGASGTRTDASIVGIRLFGVDARIVVVGLDPDGGANLG